MWIRIKYVFQNFEVFVFPLSFFLLPLQALAICLKQDLNLDNADYSALHNQCLLFSHISKNQVFSFLLHAYSTCNRSQKVVKNNIYKNYFLHLLSRGTDITNSLMSHSSSEDHNLMT